MLSWNIDARLPAFLALTNNIYCATYSVGSFSEEILHNLELEQVLKNKAALTMGSTAALTKTLNNMLFKIQVSNKTKENINKAHPNPENLANYINLMSNKKDVIAGFAIVADRTNNMNKLKLFFLWANQMWNLHVGGFSLGPYTHWNSSNYSIAV